MPTTRPNTCALEPLIGRSGQLAASLFTFESLDQAEDHLLAAVIADDGGALDEDAARRLLALPAQLTARAVSVDEIGLRQIAASQQAAIQHAIRNARHFEAEAGKLDGWADDLKLGLERESKALDRQIRETRCMATTVLTLGDKLAAQKRIKALEAQRNQKRRMLFDAQAPVDAQRNQPIAEIEGRLAQNATTKALMTLRWTLR